MQGTRCGLSGIVLHTSPAQADLGHMLQVVPVLDQPEWALCSLQPGLARAGIACGPVLDWLE